MIDFNANQLLGLLQRNNRQLFNNFDTICVKNKEFPIKKNIYFELPKTHEIVEALFIGNENNILRINSMKPNIFILNLTKFNDDSSKDFTKINVHLKDLIKEIDSILKSI